MYCIAGSAQKHIKVRKLSSATLFNTKEIESEQGDDDAGPDNRSDFFAQKKRENGNEENIKSSYKGCSAGFGSSVNA